MQQSRISRSTAPIFVVGYMHSGTSLLRNILRNHSHIYTGRAETRFFVNLPIIQHQFPNLADPATHRAYVIYLTKLINTSYGKVNFEKSVENASLDQFGLTSAHISAVMDGAAAIRDHQQLFRHVYDRLTHHAGKVRWLEKTPTHLFHVKEILEAIPNALFVEIVRDPRDILSSKYRRLRSDPRDKTDPNRRHIARYRVGFDPLWDALAWKAAVRSSNRNQKLYPGKILRVRYEDLVANPERETRRICEFLHLSFDASLLEVPWRNTTDQSKWKKGGISAAAIGRWQSTLSPQDVALCQRIARAEMKPFGYTPVPVPAGAKLKLPITIGRSSVELVQRFYRRWRLGGRVYARNVLSNYWVRFVNVIRLS